MKVTKEKGIEISLSTVASLLVVIPVMWLLIRPLIATSLAEDIKRTVAMEMQPINNAFVALLQRDVNMTKKEIAALRFNQNRAEDWDQGDAKHLADKEIELTALEEAKDALEGTT